MVQRWIMLLSRLGYCSNNSVTVADMEHSARRRACPQSGVSEKVLGVAREMLRRARLTSRGSELLVNLSRIRALLVDLARSRGTTHAPREIARAKGDRTWCRREGNVEAFRADCEP